MKLTPPMARRAPVLAPLLLLSLGYALSQGWPRDGTEPSDVEALLGEDHALEMESGSFLWVEGNPAGHSGARQWHPAVVLSRPGEGELPDG